MAIRRTLIALKLLQGRLCVGSSFDHLDDSPRFIGAHVVAYDNVGCLQVVVGQKSPFCALHRCSSFRLCAKAVIGKPGTARCACFRSLSSADIVWPRSLEATVLRPRLNRRLRVGSAPCYAQRMQDQGVAGRYLGSIHDDLVRVGGTRISTCTPRCVLKNALAKGARNWGAA